jgi:hypothetical protein
MGFWIILMFIRLVFNFDEFYIFNKNTYYLWIIGTYKYKLVDRIYR